MTINAFVSLHDSPQAIGAVSGVVALALGVYNFRESRRDRRVASLSAKLETYKPPPGAQTHDEYRTIVHLSGTSFDRVVVTNFGPAVARDVSLELRPPRGGRLPRFLDDDVFPLPLLHPQQEAHIHSSGAWGDSLPQSAMLRWRDGRRGVQEREVWLSLHHII